ncbi:unnamed protein product [Leptosia nina]|uniref:Spaetzle domain-containing protein n=1 Tax=Leptosia nina TaxID=320188 RepID=A0AAV1JBI0_9NEOP
MVILVKETNYFLHIIFILTMKGPAQGFKIRVPENMEARGMKLNIPEECETLGICENVPDYPEDLASTLLEQLQNKNILLNNDPMKLGLRSRFASDVEEIPLCPSFQKAIYPKAARNRYDEWQFIINTNQTDNGQKFAAEICSAGSHATPEISSCSAIAHFSRKHEGKCIQKYILRKMFALDPTTNTVVEDFFQVPSCCTCIAQNIIDD